MCGSWTENVARRKKNFGFIWDRWNVLMMYNYWVWAQSRRSKSYIWVVTFRDSIFLIIKERRRKMFRKFYSKLIRWYSNILSSMLESIISFSSLYWNSYSLRICSQILTNSSNVVFSMKIPENLQKCFWTKRLYRNQ